MSILYYGSDGKIHGLGDKNTLMHYNHNHDKLGRFARSNGQSAVKSINDYSLSERQFINNDPKIRQLRKEQSEMTKIRSNRKRRKEADRIIKALDETAAEVVKNYKEPDSKPAHYMDNKPLEFKKSDTVGDLRADINYGKNSKCPIIIEKGGSKKTANDIVKDPKLEKMFRQYAAERDYAFASDNTSFDQYKNSIICQQITIGKRENPFGNSNSADVTVWYGEDPNGSGEMMYYDSKRRKIIGSEYYR